VIFIALWTTIFAFLAIYLLRSPKVRCWLKILVRAKLLRRVTICTVIIVAAIIAGYKSHPEQVEIPLDYRQIFFQYSAQAILKLDSIGNMKLDSSCNLDSPKPELSYVMPVVLNTYYEIVEKATKPVLTRISDTLQLELRGYRQFKNRGIKLTRQLQRRLGNRYTVSILSEGSTHTLRISYTGTPWHKEQLFALPVMEAALKYHLDPALLMSLIRHVSNFDFNFKGPKGIRGLLAMGGHAEPHGTEEDSVENSSQEGLNQIFLGAQRLSKQLQVLSQENAIATFYPEQGMNYRDANWTKTPLIKSWVDQVLTDVQFYHENGLKPLE